MRRGPELEFQLRFGERHSQAPELPFVGLASGLGRAKLVGGGGQATLELGTPDVQLVECRREGFVRRFRGGQVAPASTRCSQRLPSLVCYICGAHALDVLDKSHAPMKLLVTGGAGYIGSIVATQLLASGHEVVVLDNLERGHRSAVPPDARFVRLDLREPQPLTPTLAEGFDGVLHFAALALVGESVSHPERYYRTNVLGTLNLLEAMRHAGIPRLVFSSTCAVYGQPDRVPIAEDAPPRPANAYGASKLAVDGMIGDFCIAHGLGAVSLRYFNVAGASGEQGEDHDPETHLIPNILRAAAGRSPYVEVFGTDYETPDGTAIRDYIHIEDLSDAHLLALDGARAGQHRIFNLGNGSGFSVEEVITAAREVTGAEIPTREAPRRPGDPPMLVAAAERIRNELGWKPRKPELVQMVGDAWVFMQARPDGYSD